MQFTGIILAGGKSTRMGTDKGMVKLHNKFLIDYSLEALKPYCPTILISSNNDEYNIFGYPVIKDLVLDAGPMGGIYSCLINSGSDYNLVLACDMPMVGDQIIKLLVSKAGSAKIVVFANSEERIEPLCGSYNKDILPVLTKRIRLREYTLNSLIRSVDHRILSLPSKDSKIYQDVFLNINQPATLNNINKS